MVLISNSRFHTIKSILNIPENSDNIFSCTTGFHTIKSILNQLVIS